MRRSTSERGAWQDSPADSAYVAPTTQQLYDELDRFHIPPLADSTWGEWHYFNLTTGPDEWWYVTYLVAVLSTELETRSLGRPAAGDAPPPRRAIRSLHRGCPSAGVRLDTARADLAIGPSTVRQRDGLYHLHAVATGTPAAFDSIWTLRPAAQPVLPAGRAARRRISFGLRGSRPGRHRPGIVCVADGCRRFDGIPAYHDHNWGVWRDVTWEWGAASGSALSLLYGGVYGPARAGGDSAGPPLPRHSSWRSWIHSAFARSFGSAGSRTQGAVPRRERAAPSAPRDFPSSGPARADSLGSSSRWTTRWRRTMSASSFRRLFFQMRGRFALRGRLGGVAVADSGRGFFETYRSR